MPFVKVNGNHTLECGVGMNLMTLLVRGGYELNNAAEEGCVANARCGF